MSYTAYTNFLSASLALRGVKRTDDFPRFTIVLGAALAAFWLIFGAPPLPSGGADAVPVVFGP